MKASHVSIGHHNIIENCSSKCEIQLRINDTRTWHLLISSRVSVCASGHRQFSSDNKWPLIQYTKTHVYKRMTHLNFVNLKFKSWKRNFGGSSRIPLVFSVRAQRCQSDPRARVLLERETESSVSAASRSACRWSYWSAERALPNLLDIYPAQWRRCINLNDVKGYIQLFLLCGLDKDTGIWQGSNIFFIWIPPKKMFKIRCIVWE